ncbi:Dynein heavy chain [Mycena indigotica]|uniref:Dynein heavy chain n=1 Tax=Mycena indigotica TaxID=2126181 RepID=A0A8H6W992_9AGAR|nr:Dynein heavy chain [Mycena indigotica]KAF7306378.1 Dynein heavy chain [Mycena indigotica]
MLDGSINSARIVETEQILIIHPAIEVAIENARKERTLPSLDDLPRETELLETLRGNVESWQSSIAAVVNQDVPPLTSLQHELALWECYGRELSALCGQLCNREDVLLVAEWFQKTRDELVILDLLRNTGLQEHLERTHKFTDFLTGVECLLCELCSATNLAALNHVVDQIFPFVYKTVRRVPYPNRRSLPLINEISREFNTQLARILSGLSLIDVPYTTCENHFVDAATVFETWRKHCREFSCVAREVGRRRAERFIPIKVVTPHYVLQERVREFQELRHKHARLEELPQSGDAYEVFKTVELVDISPEGQVAWEMAKHLYSEKIQSVN